VRKNAWDPRRIKKKWHFHEYITFMLARVWRVVWAHLAPWLSLLSCTEDCCGSPAGNMV